MKRKIGLLLLLILVLGMGNAAFAGDGPENVNIPLGSNQKLLFDFENPEIQWIGFIHDLDYDRTNKQLYVITRNYWEVQEPNQFVYSLETKELCKPSYPLLPGYGRMGIEFEGNKNWSFELDENSRLAKLNDLDLGFVQSDFSFFARRFIVQGNQVLYMMDDCDIFEMGRFEREMLLGKTEPISGPDQLESIFLGEIGWVKGYDFSPNGEELIFVGNYWGGPDQDYTPGIYMYKMNLEDTSKIQKFLILEENEETWGRAFDLYTTEDHIIVLYKNHAESKGYIKRFTYEGTFVDGVVTNHCINKITEGPNGSTIYIQERYPEEENQLKKGSSVMEVIQINWNGDEDLNQNRGPRPVIQEQTRSGHTVARFTDHQFGLLRVEEPETGIVDYQAPIRSNEDTVKLQIPYCDIKAKFESGARNLLVEYQGKELSFPMDLFDCDDMLATMPCQSDATIEIIMHTDEAGTITYEVQLFVVEQVNAMTRVVHRRTIQ